MAIKFNLVRTKLGLDDEIRFGTRHRGETILEILESNPTYISWLIQNTDTQFYQSVHEELARKIKKHVPRGAGVKNIYYGDLRGEMAHETMSQIQQAWDEFDDIPF